MTTERKKDPGFQWLTPEELALADVIDCYGHHGPFATATVTGIGLDYVELTRPYGVTADFSYTGGVIHYTGLEVFKIDRLSRVAIKVWKRKELK